MATYSLNASASSNSRLTKKNSSLSQLNSKEVVIHSKMVFIIGFVTIPMLVIPSILLGLVFSHAVERKISPIPILALPTDKIDNSAYFIDFSATQLTTFASWASSIATLLPGALVTMCGYPVAKAIMRSSEKSNARDLPTPYQLSLLLGSYNGSLLDLWNWISYLFWKRREKMISVFRFTLAVFILSTCLTYLIWAADTWLHITTSTTTFTQIIIPRLKNPELATSWGVGFLPECQGLDMSLATAVPGANYSTCINTVSDNTNRVAIDDGESILSHASSTRHLITLPRNNTNPEVSFFSFMDPNSQADWIAFSYGFSSSCRIINKECDLHCNSNTSSQSAIFNCSENFAGVLSYIPGNAIAPLASSSFDFGYYGIFSDTNLTDEPMPSSTEPGKHVNPFVAVIAAQVFANGQSQSQFSADSDIVTGCRGTSDGADINYIMLCEVDISDMTYSVVNGTATQLSSQPSNDTVAVLSASWALWSYAATAPSAITDMVLSTANSSITEELTTRFSSSFSKICASFSAVAFSNRTSIAEQYRSTSLVTRVPKAPLYILAILCYIMSILGVILSIVTSSSHQKSTREVQQRLSVASLISAQFEGIDKTSMPVSEKAELFEERSGGESVRVGITRSTNMGWEFKSFGGEQRRVKSNDLVNGREKRPSPEGTISKLSTPVNSFKPQRHNTR